MRLSGAQGPSELTDTEFLETQQQQQAAQPSWVADGGEQVGGLNGHNNYIPFIVYTIKQMY